MRDFNVAGRDVNTVNKEAPEKDDKWLWKILRLLIIPLLMAALIYVIYSFTGVKLSDFSL